MFYLELTAHSTGVHLADASMWLACTSVLAVYDIRLPMKDGKLVLPAEKFTSESIRCDVVELSPATLSRKQ